MWTTSLDSGQRRTSLMDATIDVLVEPRSADMDQLAVVRVTIPAAATMPRHDHGKSEAVLIPLAGELLLSGPDGRVERLQVGTLATVSAHERVSVQNPGAQPASMLVCFAPPAFVEALRREPVPAQTDT